MSTDTTRAAERSSIEAERTRTLEGLGLGLGLDLGRKALDLPEDALQCLGKLRRGEGARPSTGARRLDLRGLAHREPSGFGGAPWALTPDGHAVADYWAARESAEALAREELEALEARYAWEDLEDAHAQARYLRGWAWGQGRDGVPIEPVALRHALLEAAQVIECTEPRVRVYEDTGRVVSDGVDSEWVSDYQDGSYAPERVIDCRAEEDRSPGVIAAHALQEAGATEGDGRTYYSPDGSSVIDYGTGREACPSAVVEGLTEAELDVMLQELDR